MSILSVLFTRTPFKNSFVNNLIIDAVVNEHHEFNSTVTKHPIENGGFTQDHIYDDPRSVQIEGEITNSPMTSYAIGGITDRRVEGYDQLVAMRDAHVPVLFVSGLKVYDDMVIEKLSFSRDNTTGQKIKFNMTLTEMRFSASRVVGVAAQKASPSKKDKVAGKQDAGKQETVTATPEQEVAVKKSKAAGSLDSLADK